MCNLRGECVLFFKIVTLTNKKQVFVAQQYSFLSALI
jgi:hypothetical protein